MSKGITCPECYQHLKLGPRPIKGQQVRCSGCGTKLIVTGLEPVEVEAAFLNSSGSTPKKRDHVSETICPECDNYIKINTRLHPGQLITCQACSQLLEIISINPIDVDVAAPLPRSQSRYQHR